MDIDMAAGASLRTPTDPSDVARSGSVRRHARWSCGGTSTEQVARERANYWLPAKYRLCCDCCYERHDVLRPAARPRLQRHLVSWYAGVGLPGKACRAVSPGRFPAPGLAGGDAMVGACVGGGAGTHQSVISPSVIPARWIFCTHICMSSALWAVDRIVDFPRAVWFVGLSR